MELTHRLSKTRLRLTSVYLLLYYSGKKYFSHFSDQCCKDRRILQDAFGSNIRVVLDTFHCLQRVTRTVMSGDLIYNGNKKRRLMFFRRLRMILRQSDDQEKMRKKDTPCVKELISNIESLLVEFEGELREKTVTELRKIIDNHATCLASVPVKVGTQQNEG